MIPRLDETFSGDTRTRVMAKLPLLYLLLPGLMLAGDVTGKWSGSSVMKTPDGQAMHDSVWMSLKQTGAVVTGTAGPGSDRQTEIKEGKVDGARVQFSLAIEDSTATVRLTLEGEQLKGQAEVQTPDGKLVLDLDLKRVP